MLTLLLVLFYGVLGLFIFRDYLDNDAYADKYFPSLSGSMKNSN